MTENTDPQRPEGQAQEQTQDRAQSEQTEGPVDPVETLQQALAAAQAQVQEHYDNLLRAQAEMENVRRRAQEEVAKARKFGIESFAEGLVPVKDSLEAALAQADQSADDMRAGIQTTLKQLAAAFERNHLTEIAPAAGEKFDPHHHQAIATVPAEQDANTVVAVLQKGYLIADRVLRPALVTVAS
ncbi:MAG: nucleotide exchange factor GrpE [Burkholderiaceae bacterium]|nr:nucleotide exchange factor GrpE [Burkholderiaceae bacterium]MCD8516203.1 nucleotide exchange factor GrpE [Burkholderiaceae bacterium]